MAHRFRFPTLLALAAALIALGIVSSGSAVSAAGPPDGNGLDHAIAVQEAHTEELLNIQGVVGTGVGLGADGQPVIVIYAQSAGVAGLPSSLEGVPVDVVVTGMIVALTDPTARQPRPVPIGVSTGHPDITAGTIGARVTDGTSVFALSNNHVYANTNEAEVGDSALQPGPADGGQDPADKIGELSDFEPILFDGSDNTIDAAIAISSTLQLGNSTPTDDGYGTPNSTIISCDPEPECGNVLGLDVQKYGRTTGLTRGDVSTVNVTVDVCYKSKGPFRCDRNFIARFVDQIAIGGGAFSDPGDSGSLIVTNDASNNPVALLFAGSSTTTFANRIDLVLPRFNVAIDDSAPAPVATGSIAGTVTNFGDGTAIGGATVSTDTGQSAITAADGTYTITDVPTGDRSVTASADGFESQTKPASVTENQTTTVDFALSAATTATTVSVSSITYATEGGKNQDKHLLITVALVDDLGNEVSGASVSIDLFRDGSKIASGTGTTATDGTVTFSLKNAKSGCYTTTATDVTAAGLTWDGLTPANEFCK